MYFGWIALLISIVAAFYIMCAAYLMTRAMYRALRNTPPAPTMLHIVIDDLDKHLDKKVA